MSAKTAVDKTRQTANAVSVLKTHDFVELSGITVTVIWIFFNEKYTLYVKTECQFGKNRAAAAQTKTDPYCSSSPVKKRLLNRKACRHNSIPVCRRHSPEHNSGSFRAAHGRCHANFPAAARRSNASAETCQARSGLPTATRSYNADNPASLRKPGETHLRALEYQHRRLR